MDNLKLMTEKLYDGKKEIEKSIAVGKEYFNRGGKQIIDQYLVEPYLKKPMGTAIQSVAVYT